MTLKHFGYRGGIPWWIVVQHQCTILIKAKNYATPGAETQVTEGAQKNLTKDTGQLSLSR
jgi:hypothetical protein